MSSYEAVLHGTIKYVSLAIVTCAIATGGLCVARWTSETERGPGTFLSPAHWMFWLSGRDLEQELRNPTPVFEFETPAIPVWDTEQVGNLGRLLQEDQEKRDQMMEEIRARWGTPD